MDLRSLQEKYCRDIYPTVLRAGGDLADGVSDEPGGGATADREGPQRGGDRWAGGLRHPGGEKQRISIARAILKDAPIILLDEATASVDSENDHLIQAALSELTRGKTILTIAHRLATIQNAEQILVADDGRIVQRGTHEELTARPGRYRSFVETRRRAEEWNIV